MCQSWHIKHGGKTPCPPPARTLLCNPSCPPAAIPPPHPLSPLSKGVENVYTQHVPPLVGTLERLAKGKLSEAEYPAADRAAGAGPPPPPPRLIVAFVVGGTTYEEAAAVAGLNAAAAKGEGPLPPGTRVLLGGTGVQNSSSFLRDLAEVAAATPAPQGRLGLR